MRILTVNEYRVEITLTPEELNGFDITYERMDYADADTRRVLWTLLSEARRVKGVSLDLSGRLLIEVNRDADGCCRVCFTALPPKDESASVRQLVKTETEPVVLECADLDDAVRAAVACGKDTPGALFYRNGGYRLILSVNSDKREAVSMRVGEFGELPEKPALLAAECDELWQCVIPDRAPEMLCKLA